MPAPLRRAVIERARHRCEYCGLAQAGQEATFHLDHVRPVNAGGETRAENLALACVSCSLRKGDREAAVDPESGRETKLFNPRIDRWSEHFQWDGVQVVGRTPMGRAMVAALRMNRPLALAIRAEEIFRQRHPPP
jgi:hypothetical protein